MKERVIFGATSAIAEGVARQWARQGDRLTLVGRSAVRLASLAKDLQSRGASHVEVAVMDFSDHRDLWDQVEELFREKERVDTLLVAQGYLGFGSEKNATCEKAHTIWDVNFESAAMILLAAKSHFVKNNHGTLAAFSAPEGDLGRASCYLYGSAKAALKVFLSGLREELAPHGIRVCTVIPGRVDTPLNKDVPKEGRFWTSADRVAQEIVLRLENGGNLYVPFYWKFFSFIRRCLPEGLARRIRF